MPLRSYPTAFILKENADSIVASLANQVEKTESLLTGGFALTKEMKLRKIRDMQSIDEQFEGL